MVTTTIRTVSRFNLVEAGKGTIDIQLDQVVAWHAENAKVTTVYLNGGHKFYLNIPMDKFLENMLKKTRDAI